MAAVQIQFTTDTPQSAGSIVRALLDERLVACGQMVGPVTSSYRWQGSLESAEEVLVILKTREELAERVVFFVEDLHPYETPEILVTPIIGGNPEYLAWIDKETIAH